MKPSLFHGATDKFDRQMALRQRMMRIAGLKLKQRARVPGDLEKEIRQRLVNCLECKSSVACEAWLGSARKGMPVPDFCANRRSIARLIALTGRVETTR
ncbi:hypothetical protein AN191_02235 [Loktanella sp. 5RATIMAR09]|uniref:DUF6455 family protein n=1 Tax=Loktanella sp. 5RATIMAR09 TaxID=1225655 RepID=UPI0006EBB323|nr:hypothetical protein AN191_02235 [Loktanella sp. 5RATIMAR09]